MSLSPTNCHRLITPFSPTHSEDSYSVYLTVLLWVNQRQAPYNVGPTCHIFDRSQKLNWIPENKIYSVALQLKRDVMLPVCFNPNIFSTGMGKWGMLSIWCNTLLITYLIRTRPHLCGQSWTEGAASLCRLSPLSATKSLLPHISHS